MGKRKVLSEKALKELEAFYGAKSKRMASYFTGRLNNLKEL